MQVTAGSLRPPLHTGWGELSQCRWVRGIPSHGIQPSEAALGGKPAECPILLPPLHSPYAENTQSGILTTGSHPATGISPPPPMLGFAFLYFVKSNEHTAGGIYSCGSYAFLTTVKGSNRAPALTGRNNFHRTQTALVHQHLKQSRGGFLIFLNCHLITIHHPLLKLSREERVTSRDSRFMCKL